MKYWDEVRTVAKVARLGTVSAASKELGVHRATVQRHVELMEDALGARLFLKHARGYTPTEAALELRRVAEGTEKEINRIARRIQLTEGDYEASVSITAAPALSAIMVGVLRELCHVYPRLRLEFNASTENLELEKGDADIAIRGGAKPTNPDYVVQSLESMRWSLYASPTYVARYGVLDSLDDLTSHYFVGPRSDDPRFRALAWINENVPPSNVVIRSDNTDFLEACVLEGAAIGFISTRSADEHHAMVPVLAGEVSWHSDLWLLTHVDQHRLPKIKACLTAIKAAFSGKAARPSGE